MLALDDINMPEVYILYAKMIDRMQQIRERA